MGIYGLTTYMREHKRTLSTTVEIPKAFNAGASSTFVIDTWSMIYDLQLHPTLEYEWVYGGEYEQFTRLVDTVVRMWLAIGLSLHFVFDGPYPSLKFATEVSRTTQAKIHPSQVFFRTSAVSRTSRQSLRENRIIPPLMYTACVHTLRVLQLEFPGKVHTHHADEEGDPFAVSLAGKLGAYVLGRDSDFIVLNADGYRGYIPLDEMIWTWTIPSDVNNHPLPVDDDFGFEVVRKGKKRSAPVTLTVDANRRSALGLLPPELPPNINFPTFNAPSDLTLVLTVYTPASLAANLRVPPSILPLVGSLVGNDYTKNSGESGGRSKQQQLFFDRGLSAPQRIAHTAATLRSIRAAAASPSPRRGQKPIKNVIDLIEAAVTRLILRDMSSMGSGEVEEIINNVAEAALQYALPPIESTPCSEVCELHAIEDCPLVAAFSQGSLANERDDAIRAEIRAQYIQAYRGGRLSPRLLDTLVTGTSWPKLFLENPDVESTARSVGAPLRSWIYALLDEALGIRGANASELDTAVASTDGDENDDELVDVVEIQTPSDEEAEWNLGPAALAPSDLLSTLGPKLEQLKAIGVIQSGTASPHEATNPASAEPMSPLPIPRPSRQTALTARTIIEYVRRGTRLVEEVVVIPSLSYLEQDSGWSYSEAVDSTSDDIPLFLRSEEQRLCFFLRILQSDTPRLRSLPSEQLMAALALRYLVRRFHMRAEENGKRKEFEQERWTRSEARAFLSGFTWFGTDSSAASNDEENGSTLSVTTATTFSVENRVVQLVAQASAALEALEHLTQVLLLSTRIPSPAVSLSGRRIHASLSRAGAHGIKVPETLWAACEEGIEGLFSIERGKVGRRERKNIVADAAKGAHSPIGMKSHVVKPGGRLFELLRDIDTA